MLFKDDLLSKLIFACNMISSFLSVGISFARLLTKGEKPVIHGIITWSFIKALLMIVCKFIIQSYILSMAIRSLLYKFVSKVTKTFLFTLIIHFLFQFQYFEKPEYDNKVFRELEERYYRGLCEENRWHPNMFCRVRIYNYYCFYRRDYKMFRMRTFSPSLKQLSTLLSS